MIASDHGFEWGGRTSCGPVERRRRDGGEVASRRGDLSASRARGSLLGRGISGAEGWRRSRRRCSRSSTCRRLAGWLRHSRMRGRLLDQLSRRPRIHERRSHPTSADGNRVPATDTSSRARTVRHARRRDPQAPGPGLPRRERGEEPVHGPTARAPPPRSATRRRSSKRLGRTAEALRCYEQALEQEPDDVAAKLNLSNLLFEGDRDAARSDRLLVEAFLDGLAAGDELVVARAAAWRERDRPDRARSLLDAAVAGAPANVPLRLFRGRIGSNRAIVGAPPPISPRRCGARRGAPDPGQRSPPPSSVWAIAPPLAGPSSARWRSPRSARSCRRALASLEDLDEPPPRR